MMHLRAEARVMEERPQIIVPKGRPGLTYARAGNVLLPLRFARQMPEWLRAGPADGRRPAAHSGSPRTPPAVR